MQAITPELAEFLKSRLQAGPSGFHGKVVCLGVDYRATSIDIDHSLTAAASQMTVTLTNESGEVGLAADAFPDNALIEAWQWYGEEANAVQTFYGFVDKISESRDPRMVSVLCRDWAKPLLVQNISVIAPQGADEPGAVRDSTNYVYLDAEVSDIVKDLLAKAGYPAAKWAIQPTNFRVAEYIGRDGMSYFDALGELADFVAFNTFADEVGVWHFQANGLVDGPVDSDNPPVPVYIFRSGEDIVSINPQRDDYETKTRVKATGPYTTLQDAWTELWHTNAIVNPTGVRYDSATPLYVYVADGITKKVYKLRQSDQVVVASTAALPVTFLNGLSGDPSDATIYWTLDTPWLLTGSPTLNKIRKHLKSDDSVLATFALPNQQWTDIKVGATGIWATNFTTDKIHLLSKADGSELSSYTVTGHVNPVGVAIDGTDLYLAFYNESTMLVSTVSAPATIVRTLAFSGTHSLGGDIDTDTHTELYATAGGLSLTYKYTFKSPVTNDVSVEVVNDALELALGAALDTGREIRQLRLDLKIVIDFAQATEAAARWLDRFDQFRNVLDFGCIGNPAIQKGDMIRVEDPVTGIANDFQVDTYRTGMAESYLGQLAVVPWTSTYGGPGDIFPIVPLPLPGAIASFMADGDGGDAIYWAGTSSNQGPPGAAGSTHYYYAHFGAAMVTRAGINPGDLVLIDGWVRNNHATLLLTFWASSPGAPAVGLLDTVVLELGSDFGGTYHGSSWYQFPQRSITAPAGTLSWRLDKNSLGGSGHEVSFDEIVVSI